MAEHFVIEGTGGAKTLHGEIAVQPAKNAVIKAMAATMLFEDTVVIKDAPNIEDMHRLAELLRDLGADVTEGKDYTINTSRATKTELDRTIAERMRASVVMMGPMLARFGKVSLPHPGGDIIGARPIDLFLDGFRRMGAEVSVEDTHYHLRAPQGLKGAEIFFIVRSHTATETLMMAATRAEGTTVLKNAALEPEIKDLADFLNSCGAKITGAGTPTIYIEGNGPLKAAGKSYRALPDRIETGSFMILGALAAKDLTITNCNPEHVEILTHMLIDCGVPVETGKDFIAIRNNTKPNSAFHGIDVRTHEYPGFATDLQAPMTIFLTQASGESVVFETIFEGRLNYFEELNKMGAKIVRWNPFQMQVTGPTHLVGKELESPDVRAGLAFLLAATVAQGTSKIGSVYHIDRGYEYIETRLQKLGLNIQRQNA